MCFSLNIYLEIPDFFLKDFRPFIILKLKFSDSVESELVQSKKFEFQKFILFVYNSNSNSNWSQFSIPTPIFKQKLLEEIVCTTILDMVKWLMTMCY